MPNPKLHRGRLAKHPRIISVESLTRDDLACLRERRVGAPRVKTLRRSHHRVARLIALGYRDADICRLTSYTPSRLGSLRNDPAMQELIASFDKRADADFDSKIDHIHEEMVELKMRGIEQLAQHFDAADENGELIPIKTLLPVITELADRTGHGKHSTVRNENVNFAEMMKNLARSSGRSNVIDAQRNPAPPAPEAGSEEGSSPPTTAEVGFLRRA